MVLESPHVHRAGAGGVEKAGITAEVGRNAGGYGSIITGVDGRGAGLEAEVAVGGVDEKGIFVEVARAGVYPAGLLHDGVGDGGSAVVIEDTSAVAPEYAVGYSWRRSVLIGYPPAVECCGVAVKCAVEQGRGRGGIVHAAAIVTSSRIAEKNAVGQGGSIVGIVHAAAECSRIAGKQTGGKGRRGGRVIRHPAGSAG